MRCGTCAWHAAVRYTAAVDMKPSKQTDVSVLGALALVGQLGIVMAIPVAAGVWLGSYLDGMLGTRVVCLLAGLFLGLGGGAFGVYGVLKKELKRD